MPLCRGKDDDGNTVFGVLDEPARFWAIFGHDDAGYRDFCAAVGIFAP